NRVNIVLAPLHPEVMGISIIWTGADGKIVTNVGRRETVIGGGWYDTSPYKLMGADGVAGIRRRLDRSDTPEDFSVLPELRASGATDYVILLGASGNGGSVFGSWTTNRPGGFEPEELLALSRAFYALAHIVEMHAL